MLTRRMIQCRSSVNRDSVTRKVIDGAEYVIVSSYTLPDDIVMNGILYPASEIAKSFHTLERTLAPVEHPVDNDGNFLLASDPVSINNFYAGAHNQNVTREGGRVHVEKHINVQEAMKSDRGKRLMDRIIELETNDKARPIHTSTGLLLSIEKLKKPMTNKDGDSYSMIGSDFAFDHDAILLDSVAAATPSKGVGMAVNNDGNKIDVDLFQLNDEKDIPKGGDIVDHRTNAEGLGSNELRDQLHKLISGLIAYEYMYIVDIFDDVVVFETNDGYYQVPYRVDNEIATVVGIPLSVDRDVTYTPKVNKEKGDVMNEMILNALKKAGIETEGLEDAALLEAYNELMAPEVDEGGISAEAITEAVNVAVKPLTEEIEGLKTQLNSKDEAEVATLVTAIVNSDKYPGISEETVKGFALPELREMGAACGVSIGVPLSANMDENKKDAFSAPAEMADSGGAS